MVSMSIRLYLLLTVADTEIKLVMGDLSGQLSGPLTVTPPTPLLQTLHLQHLHYKLSTSNTSNINSPPPTPLI